MGNWFEQWFNTDEYLTVYKHRNEADAETHINFVLKNVAVTTNCKVLDMACGAGRHSIILARLGFEVTAVDISEKLLDVAKSNAEHENLSINFIHSDIRKFETAIKFNLILNLFTSFGYFDSDEENFNVLERAYNLLEKKGYFVLDYFNSNYLQNKLVKHSIDNYDDVKIFQDRYFEGDRVVKNITIKKNGSEHKYKESVRLYSYKELVKVLTDFGFEIVNVFGDFLSNKFDENTSERVIFICKK